MITVRALHDFHLGPRDAAGHREIAIHAGETRQIMDPGDHGAFWTTDRWGHRFGLCRIGREHGWVRISATDTRRAEPAADWGESWEEQTRRQDREERDADNNYWPL